MEIGRDRRMEKRKFKRIPVRFGLETPDSQASAIQISTRGLFLATNQPVYVPGTQLVIEISTPSGPYPITAIVRHAKKVLPSMIHIIHCGIGVEFVDPPPEVQQYLDAL